MIHELTGKGRLLFPRKMFNAIVRWVLGVHSPSGTIKVSNTADPKSDKSIGLDVDIEAVTSKVRKAFDERGFTAQQRRDVCGIVRDCLDGVSLYWNDRRASVSDGWLEELVRNLLPDDPGQPTAADAPLPVADYVDSETDADKLARVGSSPKKAPLDHVHRLPDSVYTKDDFDIEDYYDADEVDAILEDYYTASEIDTMAADFLDVNDIGVTVAAYSHTHSDYAASNHTHALSEMSVPNCSNLCFLLSDSGTIVHSNQNPSVQDVRDILYDYDNGIILTTSDIDPADYYTATEVDTIVADFLDVHDIGTTVAAEGHTHTCSDITDFPSANVSGTLNLWTNGTVWANGEVTVVPCQLVISNGIVTGLSSGNQIQIV